MAPELPFDLFSFGRRGPGQRSHLPRSWLETIARTNRRTPEVMLKVLTRGATDAKAVGKHLMYVSRGGSVELLWDSDIAEGVDPKAIVEDWDLDLEEARARAAQRGTSSARTPRLVHKLILSVSFPSLCPILL
jgi:hypothetical protein